MQHQSQKCTIWALFTHVLLENGTPPRYVWMWFRVAFKSGSLQWG